MLKNSKKSCRKGVEYFVKIAIQSLYPVTEKITPGDCKDILDIRRKLAYTKRRKSNNLQEPCVSWLGCVGRIDNRVKLPDGTAAVSAEAEAR